MTWSENHRKAEKRPRQEGGTPLSLGKVVKKTKEEDKISFSSILTAIRVLML